MWQIYFSRCENILTQCELKRSEHFFDLFRTFSKIWISYENPNLVLISINWFTLKVIFDIVTATTFWGKSCPFDNKTVPKIFKLLVGLWFGKCRIHDLIETNKFNFGCFAFKDNHSCFVKSSRTSCIFKNWPQSHSKFKLKSKNTAGMVTQLKFCLECDANSLKNHDYQS